MNEYLQGTSLETFGLFPHKKKKKNDNNNNSQEALTCACAAGKNSGVAKVAG